MLLIDERYLSDMATSEYVVVQSKISKIKYDQI